ncbi:unnamed protein product [Toxocara canis]|uniref:SFM domain-containing protein n=1 Tax=Toxocara canis TaxID=6265 RepID=A0A183VG46_TOXCA|nr:unnamed protein product [Toxocara canis]
MVEPSVPKPDQKPQFGSLANEETVQKLREGEKHESEKKEEQPMELDEIDNPMEREVMAEFERRRRARTLTLPTDDGHVKLLLRKLNEPICLFGEDKLDRKERLRTILSTMPEDEVTRILHSPDDADQVQQRDTSTWYHKGPAALRDARVTIADFSLTRAAQRLAKAREEANRPAHQTAVAVQEMHRWVASLSGECSIWSVPGCERECKYVGHSSQAGCARFHPGAYVSQEPHVLNAASCAHDGTVKLWSLESDQPLSELEPLPQRVARIAFHPSGRFLASCWMGEAFHLHMLHFHSPNLIECFFRP